MSFTLGAPGTRRARLEESAIRQHPRSPSATMDATAAELNELFAASYPDGLPRDVLAELQSILRVHSITAEELFYKWESYSMKMGEEVKLTLDTVRGFKQDVQEALERESRGKAGRQTEKRNPVTATPRAAAGADVFGMYEGDNCDTPYSKTDKLFLVQAGSIDS